MKLILGLTCLLVGVALAKSCCLPDQISFNWEMTSNATVLHDGKPMPWGDDNYVFRGSGALDFKSQRAYVNGVFTDPRSTSSLIQLSVFLDLSKKPGLFVVTSVVEYGGQKHPWCQYGEAVAGPNVWKSWQCVLDIKKYFTKMVDDSYRVHIVPGLIDGQIMMFKDRCLPQYIDFGFKMERERYTSTSSNSIVISNVVEKMIDESNFKNTCKAKTASNATVIPTPEGLVKQIRGAMGVPEASDESDSDESQTKSSDEDSEAGDSSDASYSDSYTAYGAGDSSDASDGAMRVPDASDESESASDESQTKSSDEDSEAGDSSDASFSKFFAGYSAGDSSDASDGNDAGDETDESNESSQSESLDERANEANDFENQTDQTGDKSAKKRKPSPCIIPGAICN